MKAAHRLIGARWSGDRHLLQLRPRRPAQAGRKQKKAEGAESRCEARRCPGRPAARWGDHALGHTPFPRANLLAISTGWKIVPGVSMARRFDALMQRPAWFVESWPIGKSQGDLAWAGVYDRLVGFSPDGRYVFSPTSTSIMAWSIVRKEWHFTLYDLTERKPVWSISKKLEPNDWPDMYMCVFSANGKWIATGRDHGQGKEVRLWDAQTRKTALATSQQRPGAIATRGRRLASWTTAKRWSCATMTAPSLCSIEPWERKRSRSQPLRGKVGARPCFRPMANMWSSATVQPPSVWDLDGKKVAVLEGHKEWANCRRLLAGWQKTVYRRLRSLRDRTRMAFGQADPKD